MNQSKLEIYTLSWCKTTSGSEYERVTVGFGVRFLTQSCNVVDAKPITFRHLNEKRCSNTCYYDLLKDNNLKAH